MDAVTLILSALAAGASAAAQETASQAVKDAYNGLKSLIQKRFAGKHEAETALAQFERKPEVWEAPLKDSLAETGTGNDPAVVASAQKLLEMVQQQATDKSKYKIQIENAKGVVIGDNAQVTQTFDSKDE